jgi:hypothetical protein
VAWTFLEAKKMKQRITVGNDLGSGVSYADWVNYVNEATYEHVEVSESNEPCDKFGCDCQDDCNCVEELRYLMGDLWPMFCQGLPEGW